jgi:PAS domain S-box-containing protein
MIKKVAPGFSTTDEMLKLYQDLVETSQDLTWQCDVLGRFTYLNPAWESALGFKLADMRGRKFSDFQSHDAAKRDMREFTLLVRGGSLKEHETVYLAKSGEEIHLLMNSKCIRDAAGDIIGTRGTAHDITERKRVEESLRESVRFARSTVDALDANLAILDESGTIIAVNSAWRQFALINSTSLIGMVEGANYLTICETATGEGSEGAAEFGVGIRAVLHGTQDVFVMEYPCHSPKEKRWFIGRVTRFTGDGPTRLVVSHENITSRKLVEEALRENEQNYRTLADSGQALVWTSGTDKYCNYFNRVWLEFTGRTIEQELGNGWSEGVHPDDLTGCFDAFVKAFDKREKFSIVYRLRRHDGVFRWVLDDGCPRYDSSGEFIGYIGHCLDITELKRITDKLRESEEYYRSLVEATPDTIAIINPKGTITFASSKVNDVFNIPKHQSVIGDSILNWVHPDEHDTLMKRIEELFSQRADPEVREYRLVKSDKTTFWGEACSSPLFDSQRLITGLLILCRDVTEKKKLQQEHIQSQKMLTIGKLAGGIAHDFNNILGIILAYTSMLEKNKTTPEKMEEKLGGITNAVQRGAALVRQILTFARESEIFFEPVNLADMARELLPMLKPTFPKTILFHEEIEANLPYILADQTQIHQALLNLCVNARDEMPQYGSITLTIEKKALKEVQQHFASADQEWYVCIAVTDTGRGMTEETRAKIFDPFFTTKGKGTGLGLSVVLDVIQLHRGFINVNSKVGQGTTFRLYFPAAVQREKEIVKEDIKSLIFPGGTETKLLVEDEKYLLEMVLLTLKSHGYRVYSAQDGLEAVEVYKKHKDEIALVLSDMGLTGLTGTINSHQN